LNAGMQINGDVERIAAQAAAVDRDMIRLIASIMDRSDRVAATTGVPVEVWLASVTRLLPAERRRLLAAAETLPKMPGVWGAFQDGLLSWSQVCAVLNMGRRLRAGDRTVYDTRLAVAAVELADADAGALLDIADMVVKQLDHVREAKLEAADADRDILLFQPRLDRTGGTIWGDFTATSFTAISDAIVAAAPSADVVANPDADEDVTGRNRVGLGRANAAGLLTLCSTNRDGTRKRPLLLATVELETLLGLSDTPAQLLTTLTGGHLHVTADTARRLSEIDGGVDLRLVVNDPDGRTVGVGRKRRIPPDWLRQAVLANQTMSTGPTTRRTASTRSARQCQLDHAQGWDDDGRTDADNLHPLAQTPHTSKTNGRVAVAIAPDGSATWTDLVCGMTLTQPSLCRLRRIAAGRPPAPADPANQPAPGPDEPGAMRARRRTG